MHFQPGENSGNKKFGLSENMLYFCTSEILKFQISPGKFKYEPRGLFIRTLVVLHIILK